MGLDTHRVTLKGFSSVVPPPFPSLLGATKCQITKAQSP
jgi:hypothetical protein